MDKRYFSEKLVKWYQANKRNLPWRNTRNAYKIWLAEIILQQTRVNQGLPYYQRFIKKYPAVADLAKASEQEVLRLWQGLGYYTRARNLHKCAKTVVTHFQGKFPKTYQQLITLPGIGEYTGAAVASFAFKQPVAVVDGNVFRVLSRIFGIDEVINSPAGKREFTALANTLIPQTDPDLFNQAIMDFGATHCKPGNPDCETCVFKSECFAYANTLQNQLPVKAKAKSPRKRFFYYLVFERGDSLLMKKRDGQDIWLGLFDFCLVEKPRPVKPEMLLNERNVRKMVGTGRVMAISKSYKHVLSHQIIHSKFIRIKIDRSVCHPDEKLSFYSIKKVVNLPKPVLISRFLNDHYLL